MTTIMLQNYNSQLLHYSFLFVGKTIKAHCVYCIHLFNYIDQISFIYSVYC